MDRLQSHYRDRVSTTQPADLEPIMHTALSVGARVQMAGGYTARVRDTVRRVALNLGAEEAQCWLSSGSVGLTLTKDGVTHTAVRTVPALGVNFTELSELSRLSKATEGKSPTQVQAELDAITASRPACSKPPRGSCRRKSNRKSTRSPPARVAIPRR